MADEPKGQNGAQEKVAFSAEQQAFIDEVFSKRIREINQKHESELNALKAAHQKEIEKSKMDEQTRLKVEEEERINSLTKRAEDAERRLRVTSAEKELAKAGLPVELAETVMGADDGQMMKNIASLSRVVTERANSIYAEKVSSGAPDAPRNHDASEDLFQRVRAAAGLK